MRIEWKRTKRQKEAWKKLSDNCTIEILYGGAAGGGKSYLGCVWLIYSCLKYPGTRWLMGRAVLKNLKESTLKTFLEIIAKWGLNERIKYNSIDGYVRFDNGSEILLKDLFLYPSDPEFDSLGSTEFTGAFIDEASQVTEKAKNIVLSRLRYKLDQYNLIPKLLICSNPAKNWMYAEFYKLYISSHLPIEKAFIPALPSDNINLSPYYIDNLKRLDEVSKQRLLFGNWEYDDDPAKLMEYDALCDLFTNTYVQTGTKYITSDLAMQGRDKFVIAYWEGMQCKIVLIRDKSSGKMIEEDLKRVAEQKNVSRSHVVVDSDGMGNYLESYMSDIKAFHGGNSAFDKEEYANLRSECYFKLAELINKREIYIDCDNIDIKNKIINELEQIKRDKVDNDEQKKRIIKKEDIKKNIGHSPDFADVLMMRMYFEVKPKVIIDFV